MLCIYTSILPNQSRMNTMFVTKAEDIIFSKCSVVNNRVSDDNTKLISSMQSYSAAERAKKYPKYER
jgi:hypothetical protein